MEEVEDDDDAEDDEIRAPRNPSSAPDTAPRTRRMGGERVGMFGKRQKRAVEITRVHGVRGTWNDKDGPEHRPHEPIRESSMLGKWAKNNDKRW